MQRKHPSVCFHCVELPGKSEIRKLSLAFGGFVRAAGEIIACNIVEKRKSVFALSASAASHAWLLCALCQHKHNFHIFQGKCQNNLFIQQPS